MRARCLDAHDNVIVGTEPNGRYPRFARRRGFVLYEMPKK
jgi:hypothetical protein